MNLGNLEKKIESTKVNYIVELLVGGGAILISFTPIFKEYTFFSIPSSLFLPMIGLLAVAHSILKLTNVKKEPTIELYEKGIKVQSFISSYDDLIVRVNGNKFTFSNETEKISVKISLGKKDYQLMTDLGKQ